MKKLHFIFEITWPYEFHILPSIDIFTFSITKTIEFAWLIFKFSIMYDTSNFN